MTLPSWTNSGPYLYDFAINGVPFLSAASPETPYVRASADGLVEQVNTASEPGEQSLGGWWYRSQTSFHRGAGARFNDVSRDRNLAFRFDDSHGVRVSSVGEVTLLRRLEQEASWSGENHLFLSTFKEGVVVGLRQASSLKYFSDATGLLDIDWGGSVGDKIADLQSDGDRLFILSEEGLHRFVPSESDVTTGTLTTIYRGAAAGSSRRDRMRLAKDRLLVSLNHRVYGISPYAGANTYKKADGSWLDWTDELERETAKVDGERRYAPELLDSDDDTWTYWGFAEGPAGFYIASGQNDKYTNWDDQKAPTKSVIRFVGLAPRDGTSDAPEFLSAVTVAELPSGEAVRYIEPYMGTFLLIGTNKGFRVAIIGGDGSLVLGSLHDPGLGEVTAIYPRADEVLFGTANSDGYMALWSADLSQPLEDGSVRFSVSKSHFTTETFDPESPARLSDVAMYGTGDRIALVISRSGDLSKSSSLWVESQDATVQSGWLRTSRIRMDTLEDKVFQGLRVYSVRPDGLAETPGGAGYNRLPIEAYWIDENGTETSLGDFDTLSGRFADFPGSEVGELVPHPWVQYRFRLSRPTAAGWDSEDPVNGDADPVTLSPIMAGYQVKSQPANVRTRLIQVPLMCFSREAPVEGRVVERSVFERLSELEAAERSGATVLFQDFGTGEERECWIERVVFESRHVGENQFDRSNPGGVLTVTLRTVS